MFKKSIINTVIGSGAKFDDIWRDFAKEFEKAATPMNMIETDDSYIVELLTPGVEKDEIVITVKDFGNKLLVERKNKDENKEVGSVIRREFFTGKLNREVEFPSNVSREGTTAKLEKGVLTITVKKASKTQGPTTIKVN